MPGLHDDKIQAIKELRRYGYSQQKTAEICDTSRKSVKKYEPDDVDGYEDDLPMETEHILDALSADLNLAKALHREFLPDGVDEESGGEYTGDPPSESALRSEAESDLRFKDDYSNTKPGEFIKLFFDEFEVGVKSKFVQMQARRADRRGEVPNEEKMLADLKDMSSGVKNDTEARYIAEEYWAEAENFLAETDHHATEWGVDESSGQAGNGDFVSPGQNGGGQGSWVQVPGQGMMYGTFMDGPNGQKVFQPMQPPGGQQGQGQMMGGQQNQNQEVEVIREELKRLREDMRDNEDNGLANELRRFKEIQAMMEDLSGDSAGGENQQAINVLRQELRGLREEVSGGGDKAEPENPQQAMFQRLMSDESVSTDKLLEYAEKLEGNTDPEVRQKEIERDLELRKMEQKREQTENIVSSLSGIVERFGAGLGAAIAQSGEDSQQQQQSQQPQQEQSPQNGQAQVTDQQPQQTPEPESNGTVTTDGAGQLTQQDLAAEPWDCPECGETTMVNPAEPGVECASCDFSKLPCPDCSRPVEVPPEDEVERSACPECEQALMLPDDIKESVACLNCDWTGPAEEAVGDVIDCEHCGAEHYPQPSGGQR